MAIRMRVRGPSGVETIQAEDDWTIEQLVKIVREKFSVTEFSLKSGYPPSELDLTSKDARLTDLKLNGETLTLVPAARELEDAPLPDAKRNKTDASPSSSVPAFQPKGVEADETTIEWPEAGGYLVLRVMPDDNSCMFTAFGGVVQINDPAARLRREVAQHLLNNPEKYTKAILEDIEPQVYATRLKDPQRWGGAIELQCLSEIYDIQICSIDVKYGRVDTYGLDKDTRCILLYSGIHYDRIAQSFALGLPVDSDVTQWATDNDAVIDKAKQLAKQLKGQSYYTDTQDMVIRCNVPGCENWIGSGEKDMVKHTKETGHTAFEEMQLHD